LFEPQVSALHRVRWSSSPGSSRHVDSPSATLELEWAWSICADLFSFAAPDPNRLREEDLNRELIFCLLGGFAVPFELARSASNLVWTLNPFSRDWTEARLKSRLMAELSKPQFQPQRSDGALRTYRFPKRKAELIVGARRWLHERDNLLIDLQELASEGERRQLLCDCPGVGPKTASWLLRNLGLAFGLAVLDVHVLRALQVAGRITSERLPRDYDLVEAQFLAWCDELGASPAAFDLFVWEWQRGSLTSPSV
jgi:thermostable 8-oxoguanine DNA glycosylase